MRIPFFSKSATRQNTPRSDGFGTFSQSVESYLDASRKDLAGILQNLEKPSEPSLFTKQYRDHLFNTPFKPFPETK